MSDIKDVVNQILDENSEVETEETQLDEYGAAISGAARAAMPFVKKAVTSNTAKKVGKEVGTAAATSAATALAAKAKSKLTKKRGANPMEDTNVNEAEMGVVNAKSEEDADLYQDAEGKHAKIDTDKGTEGKDKKNKASIAGKAKGPGKIEDPTASGTPQERMEDVMGSLFDGEDLSEEFMEKTSIIFEAAVNDRVAVIEEELTESYETLLAEHMEEVTEGLAGKLDEYLNYVVENWLSENAIALESGVRTNVSENFIHGLKGLFESCWIDVPQEKVAVLDAVHEANQGLQEQINELVSDNVELKAELMGSECGLAFAESCDELTDMEIEKFASLVEGIEFDSVEQYAEKISVIKENYFGENAMSEDTLDEQTTNQIISEENSPGMEKYVNTISRHLKG
tara:strand:- start:525 stop:1721 length:1197 start_codon:yes stop_codon:yes gene_type:complete